jgi:hypothetical protein
LYNVVPVIVPTFDGIGKMSTTMKDFLQENYPDVFATVPFIDLDSEMNGVKHYEEIAGKVGIKVACSEWVYEYEKPLKRDPESDAIPCAFKKDLDSNYLHFFLVPIVKAANYSKRQSHDCFFKMICNGMSENLSTVLLTDCGTIFSKHCLSIMMKELYLKEDLIGVTARQRAATPSATFQPCHASGSSWISGLHARNGEEDSKTCCFCSCCWKCWLNFFFSPAALQGYEFEATLHMKKKCKHVIHLYHYILLVILHVQQKIKVYF